MNNFLARLPGYLSQGFLKINFLGIYPTTSFGVGKVKNTSAARLIFFLKMFKIDSKFLKIKKKIGKNFFVSEINESGYVAINCLS